MTVISLYTQIAINTYVILVKIKVSISKLYIKKPRLIYYSELPTKHHKLQQNYHLIEKLIGIFPNLELIQSINNLNVRL